MQGIVLKKSKMTMSFVILLFNVITGKIIIDNSFWSAVITDMMLYEHENIDFDIDVLFDGREFNGTYSDTVFLKISRFSYIQHKIRTWLYLSFNNIEIDYNSLPVKKVSNKAAVFHDAPASIKM